MVRHITPGAPIDEIVPSPRSIAAWDTSVTAIVGTCDQGPLHVPTEVLSIPDFETAYGDAGRSRLGQALTDFLANGGTRALAVRAEAVVPALRVLAVVEVPFQLLVIDPAMVRSGDLAEADVLCEERRAFLVADAERGETTLGVVPADLVAVGARNAAVYYPRVVDAAGVPRPVAPCVAGVFARNDRTRGVWKMSAGSSAQVVGVVDVESRIADRELDRLTGRCVNVVRRMPDGNVVVWGSRTVAPDPEWKYVNVRRFLLFLEHSIEEGLQWVVFEPNGEPLWAQVRAAVEEFLASLWRRGAFPGARPEDGFFVQCDHTTMTEDDVRAGRLVVLVGVATIRPAEFVIVRIGLHTQQER